MSYQTNFLRNKLQNRKWTNWCKSLWHKNEQLWIRRNGQDHFYREKVVLPALLEQAIKLNGEFKSLIDLGSGDGHVTDLFLQELNKQNIKIDSLLLIDLSELQLEVASKLPNLKDAKTVQKDLIVDDWSEEVLRTPSPKLFLSVFVLQEIPNLSVFFERLSAVMNQTDVFFAVFVAPQYSENLLKRGEIEKVEDNNTDENDWEWAGKYPISIDSKKIFLPHFQRSMENYQKIALTNGLWLSSVNYLSVPDIPEAHRIFKTTVYGENIIGVKSSVLVSLRKNNI